MTIDVSPRSGLAGVLDRFTGPRATGAELVLQFLPPLIAAILAPAYAISQELDWSPWQLGLAALLALDLLGGVLTNATATAKRWYHRPGQGFAEHFSFVLVHLLHIAAVAWLFRGGDGMFFLAVSGYLILGAIAILRAPLYLQRPIALGLYGLALLGDRYLFTPTDGLEWFLGFFFLKLFVSHLVFEESHQRTQPES